MSRIHRMIDWLADWRHGPTQRRVWALAAPMIISNLTVPLVSLADTSVAGHLNSAQQLAAVAVGSAIYTLPVWMCGFLRMGMTGFAAQAVGRSDGAALRRIIAQSLLLSLLLAALVGVVLLPLLPWVLHVMRPSPALDTLAAGYVRIRLIGLPAALANYALVGALLGAHRPGATLRMLLVTNIGNIVLDIAFVFGLHLGVNGIAAASACGAWLGCLTGLSALPRMLRAYPGRMHGGELRRRASWTPLLVVNRDIFLRSLALQAVFFALTALGSRLGAVVVAANALLLNGLMIVSFALDGLANAVEALCGGAIGRADRPALRRALVVAGGWSLLGSLAFALLFALGGRLFVTLQTDIAAVHALAVRYLPYLAVLPLVSVASYVLDGLFVGATRARQMRNSMLACALAFALLVAILLPWLGNDGLWLAFLAFMAARGASLGWIAWRIARHDAWIDAPAGAPPAGNRQSAAVSTSNTRRR